MKREVISVSPETSIADAANIMIRKHISGLPVINSAGELVGIISEGDFLRRVEINTQRKRNRWSQLFIDPGQSAVDFSRERGRKVADVMTPDPITVSEDAPLETVVGLMKKNNVKRLPVMSGNRMVGIVARSNLLLAVASLIRDVPDPTATDDQIRDRIVQSISNNEWRPINLDVVVRNGVANISGFIVDERSRSATMVAVENVSGVKAVHDHFHCVLDDAPGEEE